jgi:restriction system protein
MAKQRGYLATAVQAQQAYQREIARQQRAYSAAVRAHEQAVKAAERVAKADIRERAALHAAARANEVEAMNADLESELYDLTSILAVALKRNDRLEIEALKERLVLPLFQPGWLDLPVAAPDRASFTEAPLSLTQKLMPGAKAAHERACLAKEEQYAAAYQQWQVLEASRKKQLEEYRRAFDDYVVGERVRVAAQHADVDRFHAAILAANNEAILENVTMVLEGSLWPTAFPHEFSLAYDQSSKLLGVDYILPGLGVVPDVKTYKYVKAGDKITSTNLPQAVRKSKYAEVLAMSALRVLHEVFESEQFGHIDTVALNCYVRTINPATGQSIEPCLLSVRTTRDTFSTINLAAVQPQLCLKALSAEVSPSPAELTAVRPVVELRAIDPRFVQEQDVLSALDQRPNLMDLSPGEFESLITNLFMKMGLESRQTQSSRDGGVDCVAYDPRPIFGGKVVIQAKRYKNTVGVSAVRDLYGTMQNEGASKGILVTTSGYGKASYEFAGGKPLELLTGGNLLHLLDQHVDIQARIVMPDDWKDAVPDAAEPVRHSDLPPPPPPSAPGTSNQHMPFPAPTSARG